MPIIEFSNISLKFEDKELFNNFSLSINEGEKIVISGKSGNGKSTLIKLLLGFSDLDDGKLYLKGEEVKPADFQEVRKLYAYVNQDVTLRPGIVKEVLKEISHFSANNYDGSIDEELAALFEFDLSLLNKDTQDLSGGERQRLGIILAIMLNRQIFLLDEVTSALDQELKKKVVAYFSASKKTVIAISHDNEWLDSGKFRQVNLNG